MSSLYVHIPFCDHICTYCDFCKVFYQEKWADDYLEALLFEITDKHLSQAYDTIYIGGGTPSALSLKQLERLFQILQPLTRCVQEYSIEINPESMNDEKINMMKKYGINRVSIGVQSFRDDILKTIGRHHLGSQALALIKCLQANGFDDLNVDLIYGLPNQTLEDVYHDIDKIAQLGISHLSLYSLILEDYTILKAEHYQPLNDEEDALWYDCINDYLDNIGFQHYEVSNYYKGKPSLHNLVYWHYEDYDGIGLGAHSLKKHHRLENTKSLTKYINHHYLKEDIFLSCQDELFEKIMMGLRLVEGINIDEINNLFHIDLMKKYATTITKYQRLNFLQIEDNYLSTTSLGMKYLNDILIDFMD